MRIGMAPPDVMANRCAAGRRMCGRNHGPALGAMPTPVPVWPEKVFSGVARANSFARGVSNGQGRWKQHRQTSLAVPPKPRLGTCLRARRHAGRAKKTWLRERSHGTRTVSLSGVQGGFWAQPTMPAKMAGCYGCAAKQAPRRGVEIATACGAGRAMTYGRAGKYRDGSPGNMRMARQISGRFARQDASRALNTGESINACEGLGDG
jgi:hypothetical protein